MKPLRVGVIGLGLGHHHAEAYANEECVDRVVLCDPNPSALEKTKREVPRLSAVYQSVETMFAQEDLDAVSIVTPDNYHRLHAEMAFQAGCHVLLTKPIAPNLDDARAIIQAGHQAQRKLMVAHERRFRKGVRYMKQLIERGEFGDIIFVRAEGFQYALNKFTRAPWYASPEALRTALVGSGIHQVDLIRYLTGQQIEAVTAFGNTLGDLKFPSDKTRVALFQLAGGTVAQATITYEATPGFTGDEFRLMGTQGSIVNARWKSRDAKDFMVIEEDADAIVAGTHRCVKSFLASVVEDSPVEVSGEDAFASLAACVAADEASYSGLVVQPAHFQE